ncbi:MAG: phosphoglucosamine mutase [Acidobacteria bacterium]|nr:phosphoglucosamine mutase [Acidobacteriota bacterium]MCA1643121.1 phosphoglucosamine mutase [Acidobacteriota bacterium]
MEKLFGTDGMRGVAGRFPLDAATVRAAGYSLARRLAAQTDHAPTIVTGRDTRESGAWIERALTEGAREGGAACESAGVITTPGVAYLARTLPADAGIVISASHNPYRDNGIKIFAPSGRKLDDATERLVEADIYEQRRSQPQPAGGGVNQSDAPAKPDADSNGDGAHDDARSSPLAARYLDYIAGEIGRGLDLKNLSLVVDCANGAACGFAPEVFRRLGARVASINDAPDGRNINHECGSLFVERLRDHVAARGADLGVAFDGDADRALFVDARGTVVDGDATLWVMANHFDARGELAGRKVVATVMSNLGLELALKSRGMELARARVGDKYVLEDLLLTGATLGGEQSGHIIFPRVSLAGDGLITTLFLLRALQGSQQPLHALTEGFTRYPQTLVNVRVAAKRPFEDVPEIAEGARRIEARLAGEGRLLLRYSGTEPLARVMIEGRRQEEIEALASELAAVIRDSLGAGDDGAA